MSSPPWDRMYRRNTKYLQCAGLIPIMVAMVFSAINVQAQQTEPLTLPNAVAIAMGKNPARSMAVDDTRVAEASVTKASAAFYPRIGFTENATIGNDPVYVFGTRLRQGRFSAANFALNELNSPSAMGNFMSRVEGKWNLFDSFASTAQMRQAKLTRTASQQELTRADQELVYNVLDRYYAWLLAQKQAELAQQTVKTAAELAGSSAARVEAGTAVDSDLLSSKVNLEMRQQDLIQALSRVEIARTQLETALGAELASGQQPAEMLQEHIYPSVVLEEAEARALRQRSDLQALAAQMAAQRNGVRAAKAAFGPHLDVYGSYEADNPSFTSGGNTNWMTGVELRVNLFSRENNAALASAKAQMSRTQAAKQSAQNEVRLQVRRAFYEYDAARQMLDVARSSIAQSQESLRITSDRYESGLTTITGLLRAEDAEHTSRTNYWQSVYHYVLSYAALQLATGDLSPQSLVVTQ
ncbi:MAG TPA: TolC family protein [Acidobacteriaceae bacterium]|nr:TolC family protein [Acidobacteriaceae bacterium]